MLAQRLDFFTRRQRPPVQTGATYSRRPSDATVETAKVLSIGKDEMGIDHVRFHVSIQRGGFAFVDEVRILALQSFLERYKEVAAA